MSQLQSMLVQRIQQGLSRKSIQNPSRWASKYRFMGNPYPGLWTFDHHPWLKGMHDSKASINIGQKAAQMGYTEWALNVAFHFLDIKRMDVLYVLPNTRPDGADFSSGRFDKALELSEHLKGMFSDTQNIGHKRAGSTNFYIRGSNARSGLKSIPVGLLILDELDEMNQENIPLATERLSGQIERHQLMLSTPTTYDVGINYYYNKSTEEHWHFRCPYCSKFIELRYPDNLVVCGDNDADPDVERSHLICNECKHELPHADKHAFLGEDNAEWVPDHPGRNDRGFHISQLYSMHLPPSVIAKAVFNAHRDPFAEQELHNSKLGMPHVVASSQITKEMVNSCINLTYRMLDFNRYGRVTMGVDIGKKIHVEIDLWDCPLYSTNDINANSRCKVIAMLERDDFEELDTLMYDFGVNFCVVDCQPETRKALEFANRFPGRVKLCRYPNGINGRNIGSAADNDTILHVNRTSWLDLSLGRFRSGTIEIPINTPEEYKRQIIAQIRVHKKDAQGNPLARYETPLNRHDHFGHARNYAEIALPLAMGIGTNQDIRS